jgi:molecular chaperone DnaK (HSP70)
MKMRINPDEAIAYGAAVQAAICTGEYKGYINISEITPISLGVGNLTTGELSIIIGKNTQIPATHKSTYTTSSDLQDSMKFPVYQGECVEDEFKNTKIGEFTLTGIRQAPKGETKSEVTFTIDEDGILHVTAEEKGNTRNKKSITITKNVM